MKMTDQELQNIAGDCAVELWTHESHWTYGKYKREILKALTQVRDSQSCARNQRATQFCSQAECLAKKLELAVDVLERIQYLLGEKDFSLIGEALEKIKGPK